MRIAFIQFASSSLHFAASLEILKTSSINEHQSYYCLWGPCTKYPGRMSIYMESLHGKAPKHFTKLIKTADEFVDIHNTMEFDQSWVQTQTKSIMMHLDSCTNLSQLNEFEIQGIRPGPALANEITTLTKDRDLNLASNKKLIGELLESYLQVYSATIFFIRKHKIDQIHIFNGRFLHERAVWDAARSINVEVLLFETTRSRYFQRKEGFHNRTNNQLVMLEHWRNSPLDLSNKIEIGERYFAELRGISNKFRVLDPLKVKMLKPYFVYFTSSDDEAVGFWEHWKEDLGDQISCVKKLQDIFDSQDEVELIVRLHPNLINKSEGQILAWSVIQETRSTKVILPEDQISSYDLLDHSLGSITFGSTLGLESAFSLKPTLLLAESGYDLLDVADKAKNWDDVSDWVFGAHKHNENELLRRKNNACIRGYFLATGGIEFKYTNLREKSWGAWEADAFLGKKMRINKFESAYRRIISKIKFFRIHRMINSG